MALSRPFVVGTHTSDDEYSHSEKIAITSYEGDSRKEKLSIVIELIDEFTGERLVQDFSLFLKEHKERKPIINLSGYFCFMDLPDGEYSLVVKPQNRRSDWYFLQPGSGGTWSEKLEKVVKVPKRFPQNPIERIQLTPRAAYHFPEHATLIRGKVFRNQGEDLDGIEGAIVTTSYKSKSPIDNESTIQKDVETQTDTNGEYVLYFQALAESMQTVQVKVRVTGESPIPSRTVVIMERETTKGMDFQVP